MAPIYIIDTNIIVAEIVDYQQQRPTREILRAMLTGQLPYLMSPALIDEYAEVLQRPKVQRYHRLGQLEINVLMQGINGHGNWRAPPPINKPIAPDHGDAHLWALLALEPSAVLVTEDKLLHQKPFPKRQVIFANDLSRLHRKP